MIDPWHVQVEAEADGVCGDEHLGGMIRVVEHGRLRQLRACRQMNKISISIRLKTGDSRNRFGYVPAID